MGNSSSETDTSIDHSQESPHQQQERLAVAGRPFRPLENTVLVDGFDNSRCGWYNHHIDRPDYDLNWGVVCRSSMPAHWWGSHGAQSGHYSLKLATQAQPGSVTRAIKRLTMPYHKGEWYTTLRFETFFTFHEEPRGDTTHTEVRPHDEELTGERNVRGFLVAFDLHDRNHRYWPGIRYHNWQEDDRQARWQYNEWGLDPDMDEYTDIPGGEQNLCWNSPNDSVPWKPNWHYLRIDLDLEGYGYRELQCNDQIYDLRELSLEPMDAYYDERLKTPTPWGDIDGLLNPIMSVQTNTETRSMFFVDSLMISATTQDPDGYDTNDDADTSQEVSNHDGM